MVSAGWDRCECGVLFCDFLSAHVSTHQPPQCGTIKTQNLAPLGWDTSFVAQDKLKHTLQLLDNAYTCTLGDAAHSQKWLCHYGHAA
jgi:hypothetical protein